MQKNRASSVFAGSMETLERPPSRTRLEAREIAESQRGQVTWLLMTE